MLKWLRNRVGFTPPPNRLEAFATRYRSGAIGATIARARQISMLHDDTLALLHHFAGRTRGAVMEIGPYIGGSTIAMGTAIDQRLPFVSIEMGGAHDHPQLSTTDIVADLRQNIASAALTHVVNLVVGQSTAAAVNEATALLRGQKIELLFVDADGHVGRDYEAYKPFLSDDCILVFDDYHTLDAQNVKESLVQQWVDDAEARGEITTLGIVPWATWIGVRGERDATQMFAQLGM